MTEVDEQGRPLPPEDADETTTVQGFLDWQRATLAWKCRGRAAAGLARRLPPSTLTLGGLLKPLALVEDSWFSRWLFGRDYSPPWNAVDWDADPDWEFRTAAEDSPEQLFGLWQSAVETSRARIAEALADGGLA